MLIENFELDLHIISILVDTDLDYWKENVGDFLQNKFYHSTAVVEAVL